MFKRMIVMLFLCLVVLGGVIGFDLFGKKMMAKQMAAMGAPAQTVSTTKVGLTDWQNEIKAVGSLRAAKGADLSPEVAGTVENIFFESGQDVDEGALLIQLRSSDDQAKLDALEADAHLAEITLERDAKQLKAQAIAQAVVDADAAKLESLKAQLAEQKALLEKKTILAPFAGRLGIRQIDVGQFLGAGTPIVTLQQLDPIYLDFAIPQQDLPKIAVGQKVTARTDSFPDRTFEGEISAINPKIDEATRNVDVRASFKNEDKSLRPGMFAAVTLQVGEPERFLTLPQTAITINPYGNVVYIVTPDGEDDKGEAKYKASTAFVQTGATRGDQIAVLDGIKEGDEIVTAGQMKLRNGSAIIINNSVQPLDDANPKPEDK